jgi:short subunit dehydrogenase-like uncharacterized protein
VASDRQVFDARHLAPWSWRDVAPSPWRVTGGEKVPSNLEEITDPKEVVKLLPPAFLSLVSCVQVYESMMKNDAYREEREYRRVLLLPASDARDNDIHFEASTRGIRPYVEMPFWNGRQHFLKEIVVGPSFHSRTLGGLSRCS